MYTRLYLNMIHTLYNVWGMFNITRVIKHPTVVMTMRVMYDCVSCVCGHTTNDDRYTRGGSHRSLDYHTYYDA